MNKFITIILLLLLNSQSAAFSKPDINARTAIVIDFHSDEIIYELEPDLEIYPASMTKIMTTIVAFDLIKKKKIIARR